MWIELTDDSGEPLFANLSQIAAVRPPAEGATGSRLSFVSGLAAPVQQPPAKVMLKLGKRPRRSAGIWVRLTNHLGKHLFANLELARCSGGPGERQRFHGCLPAGFQHFRQGIT